MAKGVVFTGDKTIEERLKKLSKATPEAKGYDVGFLKNNTYPKKISKRKRTGKKDASSPEASTSEPPSVVEVAIWQEFGTKNIPERPFFRVANKKAEPGLLQLMESMLTEKTGYTLTVNDTKKLGLYHENQVKEEITKMRTPPNAPATIKEKRSSNPLIDTGFMRMSVTSTVIKRDA